MYTTGGKINENGRYPANSLLRAFEIAYTEAGKPMYIEDANTDIGWRPMVGADFDTVGGKEVRFAIQDITMTFEENGQTKNVCEWAQASAADRSYIDIAEVMDLRDGTSYHIVKAPDNRCWLADNLALNPADNNVKLRLNSSNTNASDTALRNLTGIQSTTNPGWATTPVTTTSGNPYSYTNPYVNIDNKDVVSPNQVDQEHGWKDGVYYSICAISAGTYCYPSNESNDVANTAVDLAEDLCPAGWRLPTSGTVAGEGQDAAEYATVLTSLASGHTSGDLVLMLRLPHSIGPGWQAGSSAYFYSSTICGAGCIRMAQLSDYYEPNFTSVSYFLQNARCIAK